MIKRLTDLTLGLTALILLSPVLAITYVLVKKNLGTPVFFTQVRPGQHGKPFRMVKFRTMRDALDAQGNPLPDSERLTPFGRKLRATSIDELPELWNVLKGDMSLVGPRPALFNQDDLVALRTAAGVEALRPGVTGWAQINGRDDLPNTDKARLDADYLSRQGLIFDVRIIVITLVAAISGRGVRH